MRVRPSDPPAFIHDFKNVSWRGYHSKLSYDGEEEDEFEREVQSILSSFHSSLFDLNETALKPLYRIEVGEETMRVVFDLPYVDKKEDLTISATPQSLTIEARMRRPVSMLVGGFHQRKVEFDKYRKKIGLPAKIKPAKANAQFRNGILIVEFPLARKARTVRIT